ncbi:hypothetical protein Q3V30_00485 [Erwinia pyri]|uniref:Uncharacterized protein n=1 Tax=Erwinia pyri TaxID=3062598 RepID=A0AA50DJQ7_9GAMM|nr:hypothetical protein [Erwinia sp. DE2]WLS79032.1 hypothetical protein Q3V30_00485 [Erwinia sp. DE2]
MGDYRKAGKYLLIAVLLLALLWLFTRKVTSKEAFINASVTQIASPIPGTLAWRPGQYPGAGVTKSQLLVAIDAFTAGQDGGGNGYAQKEGQPKGITFDALSRLN